jgi:hypothetical protein
MRAAFPMPRATISPHPGRLGHPRIVACPRRAAEPLQPRAPNPGGAHPLARLEP